VQIWESTAAFVDQQLNSPNERKTKEMRKQKGFSLIELLIVVAIILIIAAIAIPNLLRARMAANESSAVASIRTVTTGEVTYQTAYPTVGYAPALTNLGGGLGVACVPRSTPYCPTTATPLAAVRAATRSRLVRARLWAASTLVTQWWRFRSRSTRPVFALSALRKMQWFASTRPVSAPSRKRAF
jgi:prepilin-type N-terminal cleavage/methylation domain-containing protein